MQSHKHTHAHTHTHTHKHTGCSVRTHSSPAFPEGSVTLCRPVRDQPATAPFFRARPRSPLSRPRSPLSRLISLMSHRREPYNHWGGTLPHATSTSCWLPWVTLVTMGYQAPLVSRHAKLPDMLSLK